jgi:hypothetical protein
MQRSTILLLAGILLPASVLLCTTAEAQEVSTGSEVLTLEQAVAEAREFLDLFRQGDAKAMYLRLDPFFQLRSSREQFAADVRRLLDQYGKVGTLHLRQSRDGSPFYHAYYEVSHERSTVLYHLVLSISGAVMRFDVEEVDGKALGAPPP